MVVTTLIVLAIVAGAFAFKTKIGRFCILTGTTAGSCTTFKLNFKITTSLAGVNYMYYPCWDQDGTSCTATNNNNCTAQFKLIPD